LLLFESRKNWKFVTVQDNSAVGSWRNKRQC